MTTVCDIPNCPAIPPEGMRQCRLHALARLAATLGLTGNATGTGAKHCLLCAQAFKVTDWVLLARERRPITKTGRPVKLDPVGHVHVACAPRVRKVSKRKQREAAKPLFTHTILGPES